MLSGRSGDPPKSIPFGYRFGRHLDVISETLVGTQFGGLVALGERW